jgi:hypothetical protein
MNNAATVEKDGAVAGTIPRSFGVVPRHYAALVGACRRNSVRHAIMVLSHCNFALPKVHHGATTRVDVIRPWTKD